MPISIASASRDEFFNLGWEEAIEGALTLVEWPERAGDALNPDRLEIAFELDAAEERSLSPRDPDRPWRLGGRASRARAASPRSSIAPAGARPSGYSCRATPRCSAYEKLVAPSGETAILMIAPPRPDGPILRYGKPYGAIAKLADDIRAFIAMDGALRAQGFSAPRIIAHNVADGLAILEDIGAQYIADADGPNPVRYAEAVSLLAELHGRTLPRELPVDDGVYAIPVYDAEAMLVEVEQILDWYAPHIAKVAPASGARAQFHGFVARGAGADPRPARSPGRCAIFIRPTCIGSPSATG